MCIFLIWTAGYQQPTNAQTKAVPAPRPPSPDPHLVTIDLHNEQQVIHSFGASDAWTCQFVGSNWPLAKRSAIADLLFSREFDEKGNPKGIGLSMWRFNIGAGSAEQGDKSGIGSTWHRAECFQNPDGTYDWSKQKGQQWFLEAAKARGVDYILGFSNSPPVQFTANGIAHSDSGRKVMNIRKDAIPKFADFLADVAEHFHEKGIDLDYISPVNEPQYDWSNSKQEGTPAANTEVSQLARLTGERLREKGLSTKVAVAEAGDIRCLTGINHGTARSDQVKAFWEPSSPCSLVGSQNVAHVISGHAYFTTWPLSKQVRERERLRERIKEIDPQLAFWQTEFCILERSSEIGQGRGRDLGMNTALYVARVIHTSLTSANAAQWSWWLAVSQSDFKDGLVYIEKDPKSPGGPDSLQHDGRVLASKTLWALGNFSRFVRPGMVRLALSYDDNRSPLEAASTLMASAYLDKNSGRLVVVAVNCTSDEQTLKISGPGLRVKNDTFVTYTTSKSTNLARSSAPAEAALIPARSVVTLVGELDFPSPKTLKWVD